MERHAPRTPHRQGRTFAAWTLVVLVVGLLGVAIGYYARRQAAAPATRSEVVPQPEAAAPRDVTIASWNIRVFSNASRDDDEMRNIAYAMRRFDVVAVQEVRDTRVLDRLRVRLNARTWKYVASAPVGRGSSTEIYAFFWNGEKVSLVGAPAIVADPGDTFIREPFAATFVAGEFDFTLCTIHLLYGKSERDRRPELRALDDAVAAVQAANGPEDDVILLGDFNFPPDDEGWELAGWRAIIQPPAKTTVGDVSLYDNIWFDPRFTSEYDGACGIVPFDTEIYAGDLDRARREVSDHRPVWATFRAGTDDDRDEYGNLADAVVSSVAVALP